MWFQLLAACSGIILVLLLFCLGGENIIHANNISSNVFHMPWYRFDRNSRYFIWMMISRTQIQYYFLSSYKTINLSLDTFAGVSIPIHINVWNTLKSEHNMNSTFLFEDNTKSCCCCCNAKKYLKSFNSMTY